MAATSAAATRRPATRLAIFPLVAVCIGVAILLALGVWQLQRFQLKQGQQARIDALQTAPAEPLSVVLNRLGQPGQKPQGEVDFVRVQAPCPTLTQTPTIRLYSILDGEMGDRLITACPIDSGPYRSLLVDRGFIGHDQIDAVRRGGGPLAGPVTGVLRKPDSANWLSPPNDPAHNDWHTRDVSAMAAVLHAPAPAPVMLMLEHPGAPPPGPRPAAVPTGIVNNCLGYALTWFGLAAGLVGVYAANLRRGRRP